MFLRQVLLLATLSSAVMGTEDHEPIAASSVGGGTPVVIPHLALDSALVTPALRPPVNMPNPLGTQPDNAAGVPGAGNLPVTIVDMSAFANEILRERNEVVTGIFKDSVGGYHRLTVVGHATYCLEKLTQVGIPVVGALGYFGYMTAGDSQTISTVVSSTSLALAAFGAYALSEANKRLATADGILSKLGLPSISNTGHNGNQSADSPA